MGRLACWLAVVIAAIRVLDCIAVLNPVFLDDDNVVDDNTLAAQTRSMFVQGYSNYTQHAFPLDDLRPLSCQGTNSQGGIGITLLDNLDTLLFMGLEDEFRAAVHEITGEGPGPSLTDYNNFTFDRDVRVHVFETTIRALGGLLSAHQLVDRNHSLVPGYQGGLLRAAQRLADGLLPAFNTKTGLPLPFINLRSGRISAETPVTCTACAGSLLLEFGTLSRLTGEPKYEAAAARALERLFDARSKLGLVGNTMNCDTGDWDRKDAGAGAGIDSFYEYLLKSYLMFGNTTYLRWATLSYGSALAHVAVESPALDQPWLLDVQMDTGRPVHFAAWSLSAYWPGYLALAGLHAKAEHQVQQWMKIWRRFGALPEMFDIQNLRHHPTHNGYPLRPELMESAFCVAATDVDQRGSMVAVATAMLRSLQRLSPARCGFAGLKSVVTGEQDDIMESFFLSETLKYLYLLFRDVGPVLDRWVFSTEGHPLEPWPDGDEHQENGVCPVLSSVSKSDGPWVNGSQPDSNPVPPHLSLALDSGACDIVCKPDKAYPTPEAAEKKMITVLPLIRPPPTRTMPLLRERRCIACHAFQQTEAQVWESKYRRWLANEHRLRRRRKDDRDISRLEDRTSSVVPEGAKALGNVMAMRTDARYFLCDIFVDQGSLGCHGGLGTISGGLWFQDIRPGVVIIEAQVAPEPVDHDSQNVMIRPVSEDAVVEEIHGVLAAFGPAFWEDAAAPAQLACPTTIDRNRTNTDSTAFSTCPLIPLWPRPRSDPTQKSRLLFSKVRGRLVKGEPFDLCQDLSPGSKQEEDESAESHDKVLLAVRGTCQFADKARHAAALGAAALVVINAGEDQDAVWPMAGDEGKDLESLTLPAVMVSAASGRRLLNMVKERDVVVDLQTAGGGTTHQSWKEDSNSDSDDDDEEEEEEENSVAVQSDANAIPPAPKEPPQASGPLRVSSFHIVVTSELPPHIFNQLANTRLDTSALAQALNHRLEQEQATLGQAQP